MPRNPPSTVDETARVRGPETLTVVTMAALAVAAWAALLVETARAPRTSGILDVICTPSALGTAGGGWASAILPAFALWFVMSLAMMLPTAVPMVLAVNERIDARRIGTGRARVAALALLAGYGVVWAALAAVAALAQTGASAAIASANLPGPVLAVATGTVVGFAGLYQFSDLKQRFLASCRHPLAGLPPLETPLSLARLGMAQALRCLGCCAAVMGLMGIAGLMNLAWMGAFAVAMTLERVASGRTVSRIIGVGLVAAGLALAVNGVGAERVVQSILAR